MSFLSICKHEEEFIDASILVYHKES